MTENRYIQCSQASNSSEGVTSNRCDLVLGQVSARAVSEKSRRDVTVRRPIQVSQASNVSECVTRNRCDLVVVQVPARTVCWNPRRDMTESLHTKKSACQSQ
jgi:hypothetical protein